MASKDDAKPGDGPRRPTPTHPPYDEVLYMYIFLYCIRSMQHECSCTHNACNFVLFCFVFPLYWQHAWAHWQMIATAIRSLCEEGGSSVSSISSYIQANYAGLPSGHDRLLPFYLNTYTANGLFMVSGPGHYNLSLTGGHQQQDGGGTAAAPDQPPPQP